MSRAGRCLVFGASGQLGAALCRAVPAGWTVERPRSSDVDITNRAEVLACVRACHPALVINAAAYTAVDQAEAEPERAEAVNVFGAAHIAEAAAASGARVLQVSTDYVFDGKHGRPWRPDEPASPVNVYGRTKLAGERAVLAAEPSALVMRTSWLYSGVRQDFVLTMLRLLAERAEVRVVADQVGCPTWAASLAEALWRAAIRGVQGIHHWTDAGAATWYDFAVAIREEALTAGLLASAGCVRAIATRDYPTRAQRPSYSLLDTSATREALGLEPRQWRINLRSMLEERAHA